MPNHAKPDRDDPEGWMGRLAQALKDGQANPGGLQLRHLDRLRVTSVTEAEARFSVIRRPSFFSKDRMSLYTSACQPTVQNYSFDLSQNQLCLLEEIKGEAEIDWDFLINEELSFLKWQGLLDQIVQALPALNLADEALVEQVVSAKLAEINYARLIEEMNIPRETASTVAHMIRQRLLPRLAAEVVQRVHEA